MTDENKTENIPAPSMTDALKSWMMVALTLIFVLLYVAALFGLIPSPKDVSIIARLEPIIFVIIGYYFGRLPAQANENTLKSEINRQSQKAAAAQQIKEQVAQEREILEEKIRNAKISLIAPSVGSTAGTRGAENLNELRRQETNQAVETAIKILDS